MLMLFLAAIAFVMILIAGLNAYTSSGREQVIHVGFCVVFVGLMIWALWNAVTGV